MENYTKKVIDGYGNLFHYNEKGYHRLDGHAVEYWDGTKEWWASGKEYSKCCHNRLYLFYILEPRRIEINPTED